METVFTLVAGVGMLFLVVGPIGAAVAATDAMRARTLLRMPVRTVADLRFVKDQPRRVVIRGTSAAGGGLAAPLSGTSCAWFRLTLYRVDKVLTENGHVWNDVSVWSLSSGPVVPFDDGTGAVPVDVTVLAKPLLDAEKGLVESIRRDCVEPPDLPGLRAAMRPERNTERFSLEEELVRPGVTATVVARPAARGGELVLSDGRGAGVSGLTRDEVAARLTGEAREGWWGVRAAAIIGVTALLCGAGGLLLVR